MTAGGSHFFTSTRYPSLVLRVQVVHVCLASLGDVFLIDRHTALTCQIKLILGFITHCTMACQNTATLMKYFVG